jgi:hypothetical protein
VQPIDLAPVKAKLLRKLAGGTRVIPADAFAHLVGHVELRGEESALVGGASEVGWLAYGPGESLAPGRYEATFHFASISNPHGTGSLAIDVAALQATHILAKDTIQPGDGTETLHKTLRFVVGDSDSGIEYRVFKRAGVGVDFLGVKIRKLPQ